MKTQVQTLVSMMRKGWVSTWDACQAGVTSFHRRLSDFREDHISGAYTADNVFRWGYLINGKMYDLIDRERTVKTRWGKAKIKEYRLVAVK